MNRKISELIVAAETSNVSGSVIIKGSGRVIVGDYVTIEDNVMIDTSDFSGSEIVIGCRSKIKYGAILRTYGGYIDIGSRTSIGEYTVLAGHGGLKIGDAVIVAGHCYVSAASHTFDDAGVIRFLGETVRGIKIGDGAWLGARSVVLDGVNIGDNSVVGAGSIVTKSIDVNMVSYGAPCKEIRKRSVSEVITF